MNDHIIFITIVVGILVVGMLLLGACGHATYVCMCITCACMTCVSIAIGSVWHLPILSTNIGMQTMAYTLTL